MALLRALVVLLLIGGTSFADRIGPPAMEPPRAPVRWRPMPHPPPPPPPLDPNAALRRQIVLAMARSEAGVQACADRFGVAADSIDVSVMVHQFGVDVRVARVGGARFQRCVRGAVQNAVAFVRPRRGMLSVGYTYSIDHDFIEDDRFSQPPP
jgi:hypothetical protein